MSQQSKGTAMALKERLTGDGPKRILALDGGGIRGALTLGYLEQIERILRERHGRPDLRLCDYFDLIGGTSTGAILAAGLAIGMEAADIKAMYLRLGAQVFGKRSWRFWRARFDPAALRAQLREVFAERTLGDGSIRTGLCVIAKRADTGSTWRLLNHPDGRYYSQNAGILLRHAVRASTAAPVYFAPETFDVGQGQVGAFVDGGVSSANNPALQLFLVATLKGFPFRWPTGEGRLLLVSVGTGAWRRRYTVSVVERARLWNWASEVPGLLMDDATELNQLLLQYISRTATPVEIDREIGEMQSDLLTAEPALTYLRYNAWLETNELQRLGAADLVPRLHSLREMSAGGNGPDLARVGELAAARDVADQHFPPAFDLSAVPTALIRA